VLGAPSSAARAMKAAQLLERGFNSASGLSWFMAPYGTVESLQPIAAAPPNLRDEMCGPHRKRPATEDEDDLVANNPESPYAVFLASLRPAKAKGAAPLQQMGEPVLVYTGTKPPAPGSQATSDPKPEKKKTVTIKPAAAKDKDAAATALAVKPKRKSTPEKDGASSTVSSGDTTAAKPKPKVAAPKDAAQDSMSAAAAGDGPAVKPKAKKPEPKPPPMAITPAIEHSSQTR
jgi:D-alanyl-D-alanine carboxypeptidase